MQIGGVRRVYAALALMAVVACGIKMTLVRRSFPASEPIWIDGMSMAPTLLGTHQLIACRHCRAILPVAPYDESARGEAVVCSQCGQRFELPVPPAIRPGSRVAVPSLAAVSASGTCERWRVVTVATPISKHTSSADHDVWVKRVVGLPGEHIAIRDGDIWINGKIARKSLDQFKTLAIPVSDSLLSPVTVEPEIWRRELPVGSLRYAGPSSLGRNTAGSLLWDELACEPLRSHALTPVRDFCLQVDLEYRTLHRGLLRCDWLLDAHAWQIVWQTESGRVQLFCDGKLLATRVVLNLFAAHDQLFELAYCDRRILAAVAGMTVLAWNDAGEGRALRELRLATAGGDLAIRRIRLSRDVQYVPAPGPQSEWQLAAGEYFLLGDNPAASIDCRHSGPVGMVEF